MDQKTNTTEGANAENGDTQMESVQDARRRAALIQMAKVTGYAAPLTIALASTKASAY